jgi:hypothetical protein
MRTLKDSLYNPEVIRELEADPQLALIFFSTFGPYDWEIDPLHNPDWTKNYAPKMEAAALERAKTGLALARRWGVTL